MFWSPLRARLYPRRCPTCAPPCGAPEVRPKGAHLRGAGGQVLAYSDDCVPPASPRGAAIRCDVRDSGDAQGILVPDLLKALVLSDKHLPTCPAVADFPRQLATEKTPRSPGPSTEPCDDSVDHRVGVSPTDLPAKMMRSDLIDRLFRSTVGLLVEGGHRRWLLEILVALATARYAPTRRSRKR